MTATAAEAIVNQLNEYEEQSAGQYIWGDVIWPHPAFDYAQTQDADPAGLSTVAMFTDGSSVRYLEDEHRWVVEA